nr:hypothetical protein [Streptomyces sp. NK15101]
MDKASPQVGVEPGSHTRFTWNLTHPRNFRDGPASVQLLGRGMEGGLARASDVQGDFLSFMSACRTSVPYDSLLADT